MFGLIVIFDKTISPLIVLELLTILHTLQHQMSCQVQLLSQYGEVLKMLRTSTLPCRAATNNCFHDRLISPFF